MVASSCLWICWFCLQSPNFLTCLLTPLCFCNHFICNTAACLATIISACIIECNHSWSIWMLMCLQSLPSVCICLWIWWFRVFFAQLLCFTKQAIALKDKTFTVTDFDTSSSLKLISVGMMQEGRGEWDGEFTTAVPVYSLSMSITQYGCHPVVGLCNYFAK